MARNLRHISAILLLWIAGLVSVHAQGIEGMVRDVDGKPVPYASIFIKELTRGTTCNALGQYSLPLPSGPYTIYFRSLGYTEVSKTVDLLGEYQNLEITLPPQTYMIPEVRVSATGEDPAYWVMRKTIGLANYHLNEVSRYEAEIYIKGTAIFDKIPKAIAKRVEVNDFKVKENEAYMMESMNEVEFNAPDKYDMRILASQNTIPGYTDNVNPMDYVNASLYQPQIENVISPLARNAFSHYRFEWEGSFLEGTHMVNKIKVIPRRKSQQLVKGTLYIVEELWCLHSSDLSVETMAGTIYLQQLYANVMMDAWLPVNHKLQADIEIVGIRGKATYVSSLKYTDVSLNPNLPDYYFQSLVQDKDTVELKEKPSKNEEKINELLQKEELNNREMAQLSRMMEKENEKAAEEKEGKNLDQTGTRFEIERDAVTTDSSYWNEIRPIPLTPEEHLTIQERDSIIGSRVTKEARDSTVQNAPKKKHLQKLAFGKTYVKNKGRFRLSHGGLLDLDHLGYNTVDGLYYGQGLRLNWRIDSLHTFRSSLVGRYAFHRNAPLLVWNTDLLYAPLRQAKIALYLRYTSQDFNSRDGIPEGTNLLYTLLLRENHLKLYENIDATVFNRIDLANGLIWSLWGGVGKRRSLVNNNLFSFFYRNADPERFTDNLPGERLAGAPELADRMNLSLRTRLEYTPERPYVIRNHRKAYRDSHWPTFGVEVRKAIPLENKGWSDYLRLEADIRQRLEVGLLSELDWSLSAGFYPDTTGMHFSEYRHFKASPLYVDLAGFEEGLMFSDYYMSSTNTYWFNAHARLTTSYLLIKFLPWFSERLWTESLGLSYLHTPEEPHYLQAGYSLNEVFFMMDFGIFAAFGEVPDGSWGYRGISARLNLRF